MTSYSKLLTKSHIIICQVNMVKEWGLHPGRSRAIGSAEPYIELEQKIAEFVKAPYCLTLPNTESISTSILPVLAGEEGTVLCCSAAHQSLIQGAQLAFSAGANFVSVQHGNTHDLKDKLEQYQDSRPIIIVVDGVYSMAGSYLNLPEFSRLAKEYGAYIFVDDAHGIGMLGESPSEDVPYGHYGNGIVNYYGMEYEEDNIIYVASLSKIFSSPVAFITCCNEEMREDFKDTSSYIFTGPASIPTIATAIAGLEINRKEGESMRRKVFALSKRLVDGAREMGYEVDNVGYFPIAFVAIGSLKKTLASAEILWARNIMATPAIFPATPLNRCGIRFSVTALNSEEQVELALEALKFAKSRS